MGDIGAFSAASPPKTMGLAGDPFLGTESCFDNMRVPYRGLLVTPQVHHSSILSMLTGNGWGATKNRGRLALRYPLVNEAFHQAVSLVKTLWPPDMPCSRLG